MTKDRPHWSRFVGRKVVLVSYRGQGQDMAISTVRGVMEEMRPADFPGEVWPLLRLNLQDAMLLSSQDHGHVAGLVRGSYGFLGRVGEDVKRHADLFVWGPDEAATDLAHYLTATARLLWLGVATVANVRGRGEGRPRLVDEDAQHLADVAEAIALGACWRFATKTET